MNLVSAKELLKINLMASIPTFIHGTFGVGKSDMTRQASAELSPADLLPGASTTPGLPMIDRRAAQMSDVDFLGVPHVANGLTHWNPPAFWPRVERDGPAGLLFLDELNQAQPSTLAAAYQLILDRRAGDYVLPEGWQIVAAGNRVSDKASAQRMPSALANRFAHIEVEPDLEAWCSWAVTAGISPLLIAFLRYRPALLHIDLMGDEARSVSGFGKGVELRAVPTPRTWERVNRVLNAPADYRQRAIAANVGDAPAGELEGFIRVWKALPPLASIIADPRGTPVPHDPAALYALSGALARKADRSSVDAVMTYADRMGGDYAVCVAMDIKRRDPGLQETQGFTSWCVRNQHVTL